MTRYTSTIRKSTRRGVLTGIGAVGLGAIAGSAAARPLATRGFPPAKHTVWGETASLGDGTVRPFVSQNPAGKTMFVGMEISAAAATIDADEFDEPELVALDFPGETPFEWLGLNWMPGGHGPPEVYGTPHFDIHYYLEAQDAIAEIPAINYPPGSGEPYGVALADDQMPPGYFRTHAVVENMGEHLFDATAPEWAAPNVPSGVPFTHSFVWGHWDGNLNFFEPMIATAFFEGLDDEVTTEISMPVRLPTAGQYPTAYKIAYHGNRDVYTVTLESFERFAGSTGTS